MAMTQEGRRQRIEEALAAREESETTRYQRLPWRGGQEDLPIVTLPLAAVVLRHSNHRVQAQIKSLPNGQEIEDDPFSEEAQEALAEILRNTDDFEDLKTNLEADTQLDPGVVTREGVLINANRRAVALGDLGKDFINVVVLPADAGDLEIDELESKLQMAKTYKAPYTFTNELLFVEDRISKGRTREQVARELGWAASNDDKEIRKGVKKVTQYGRLLALVREMVEMAEPNVPWTFFDHQRQAIIDFEGAYFGRRDRAPHEAERLKQKRMLAILVDSDYEVVRKLKAEDPASYLVPALREDDCLGDAADTILDTSNEDDHPVPEGLDELGDEEEADGDGDSSVDLTPLIRAVAESHAKDEIEITNGDATANLDRDMLQDAVKAAVAEAAALADEDSKAEDALVAPKKLAQDAVGKARRALEAYKKIKDHDEFEAGDFVAVIGQLENQVEAIRREIDGG